MASPENNSRILPNDEAAERAILGSVFLDHSVMQELSSLLEADDFYKVAHRELFQAMLDFYAENQNVTIDIITIVDLLNKKNKLEICGGVAYISGLTSDALSSTNSIIYAKQIRKLSMRRRLISVSTTLKDDAYDLTQDISQSIDNGENLLSNLASKGNVSGEILPLNTHVSETIANIYERFLGKAFIGYQTGYKFLDIKLSGGFKQQDYVIVGARPSIGKTAFAISLMKEMLYKFDYSIGFLSLEMSASDLLERVISNIANINLKNLRMGNLSQKEMDTMTEEIELFSTKKLYIQDTPNMQLNDIRSQARKMKRDFGIQVLFIDYIGLIQNSNNTIPRHEQIGNISRTLKQLARELNIPIIVLSQVGRQTDGQMPRLSDLRESGSIEQDADIVILLHRNKEDESLVQKTEIAIAKNRNGETGKFDLGFEKEKVRFVEMIQTVDNNNPNDDHSNNNSSNFNNKN